MIYYDHEIIYKCTCISHSLQGLQASEPDYARNKQITGRGFLILKKKYPIASESKQAMKTIDKEILRESVISQATRLFSFFLPCKPSENTAGHYA